VTSSVHLQGAPVRPDLLEEEVAQRCAWLIRYRRLAVGGVFAATALASLALGLDVPVAWLCAAGGALLALNEGFRLLLARMRRSRVGPRGFSRLAEAQFLTDWTVLILLVHLTGGLSSPLLAFFVFHAIIAAILLPPRGSYLHALGGVLVVVALAGFEWTGALPHRPIPGLWTVPHDEPVAVATAVLSFAVVVLGANHLAGSISRRLWSRTIESLALMERFEQEAERLRVLHDIARAVNSSLVLDEVLGRIVEATAHTLRGKASSIRLLDDERRVLKCRAAHGLSPEYLAKGDIEVDRSPVDHPALEGWAVQVPDVAAATALQFPDEAAREGIRSMISAPLLVRGRAIGVLRLYSADPRRWGQEEETFLMAIASQGAVAIENASAYRRLEELEAAKSRFVFQVAHELKSPVAAVRQMLSLIESGIVSDPAEHRRLVARCQVRSADLQATIDDLLALGSLKRRLPEANVRPVALSDVLVPVEERVAPSVGEKRLDLSIRCEAGGPVVSMDPDDLRKLLGNLLENAVKYTPAGGAVRLLAERRGDRVFVECSDTGIGIPADALPRLFDEFYRAPNARESHPGTGLGLSLVKRIVDLYHGEVRVDSEIGRGTTFTVILPAA